MTKKEVIHKPYRSNEMVGGVNNGGNRAIYTAPASTGKPWKSLS